MQTKSGDYTLEEIANILGITRERVKIYTPVHESPLFTTLEIKDVENFK